MTATFAVVDEIPVDPAVARVYEHGWQSWSPTTSYPVSATSLRPVRPARRIGNYRPESPAPATGFQGEGVLGLDPGDGSPAMVWGGAGGPTEVPSIRGSLCGGRLVVTADAAVVRVGAATLDAALAGWADGFATRAGAPAPRPAPTAWCSWYHYFRDVTEADIAENLSGFATHSLPVEVVQIDDGWEARSATGTRCRTRSPSLPGVVARIHDAGHRAGIWVAPFLATARSALWRAHPDWFVGDAGSCWDADLFGLDLTHPEVREHLHATFDRLRGYGFDYFKIDFVYGGAVPVPGAAGPIRSPRTGRAWSSSATRSARAPIWSAAAPRSCPASAWSTRCGSRPTWPPTTSRSTATRRSRPSGAPRCPLWAGPGSTAGSGSTTPTA